MPVGGLPLSLFQVTKIRFFMTYCNIIKAMVTRQSILDYCCPVNFEKAHFMYPHP